MKKIFFILICFFPVFVKADYFIKDYRIDMKILETGDLEVVEAFSMDGLYNGYEKEINYIGNYENYQKDKLSSVENKKLYDANKVILDEIRSINFSYDLPIEELIDNSYLFEEKKEAIKGEYGIYTINDDKNVYKIYNPSMMNKDFYIKYTLDNIVIAHEDIAEIGLQLFKNTNENINNLQITITIPNNKNNLKIWVHDIENETQIIDNETIKINIKNLTKTSDLDFRVIFDKEVAEKSKKHSDEIVLDKIITLENEYNPINTQYEKIKEDVYNAIYKLEKTHSKEDFINALEQVKRLNNDSYKAEILIKLINLESKVERKYVFTKVICTSIMGVLILGLAVILYKIYTKFNNKITKNKEYNCIPLNYKPYIVGYLIRRKVTRQDLYASLLNLINNEKIIIEKKKNEYKIIKSNTENLTSSEERLIKFLFNKDTYTTFEKLRKRAKKHHRSLINKYSNWQNEVISEGNLQGFYEDILFYKIFGICYSLISIVICALIDKETYFSPLIAILIFIISLIYFILFYKRTQKGKEEYYKCKSFKKYLKTQKKYKDEHLPYLITFGFKNKIIKRNIDKDFIELKNVIDESLNIAYKMNK